MLSKYKFHLLLHLIIFIWGFTGILGKLIHLEAFYIVWHRVLIALIGLAAVMYFMKTPFRLPSNKKLISVALVGVLVGLHWITFYKSIQLSTASLGILCLSTTTLHVTWLEPIIMKRKFSWVEFLLSLIIIYGIYFVSKDFSPDEYVALGYGLISALLAASFTVFNAKLAGEVSAMHLTFYEMIAAFVFISIALVFQGRFSGILFVMTLEDLMWLLFLGLVCTSFAFLATIEVMKRLGAYTVSLSINLEPVYTILLAIFILKENKILGIDFYVGSMIIILVVIANAFIKSSARKRKAALNG